MKFHDNINNNGSNYADLLTKNVFKLSCICTNHDKFYKNGIHKNFNGNGIDKRNMIHKEYQRQKI